jgi:outer membrane receptor for ferrienterochelin and colicins
MKISITKISATLLLANAALLADNTTNLDEVTVTSASGYEQNIKDAAATISVITKEELEKKSYTDVTDALKNIPGVNISGGGSNQSVMMRGMGAEYTLFLIDGKPMQGNDAFNPNGSLAGTQINFLPSLENIERIEVIRGPASSLYGSDAMGGVINIITKKNSNEVKAGISTEYIMADSSNKVNNDSISTSMFINAPLVKDLLSLSLNGSFLNSDESNFGADSVKSAGSDPEFKRKNFGTKLTLTPDEYNTLGLEYLYSKQERKFTPGKSLASTSDESYFKSIKNNYSATHELKYDKFLLNSYVNYDDAENPSRVNEDTGNGIKFNTLTLNTQGTYFFDSHKTSLGANYKEENLEDGATSSLNDEIVKMKRYQWSIFGEDEWGLTEDLYLTLSGRYDENEKFGDNFSPKAYLVYHLTDNWSLKGGVTSGYKAPSLRQSATDFAGVSRGGVMIGNPDLTPETSLNYETGVSYDNSDLGLKGSLVVYQTDFDDKIARTGRICEPNTPCTYKGTTYAAHQYGYTAYENVDKVEFQGLELTTDYDILENLTYRHSYTYTDSEQKTGTNKGKPLNDVSEHMFNAGLDLELTKKLDLWTQANYRSKTSGDTDGERQPAYTFADLGLVYKVSDKLKLKSGVYNVTNKEVTTEDGYDVVLDGRRYSFSMNLTF